ncbi:hypothetical protein CVT25_008982 [Psilocybe cyanescens]|uniref:Uncharacterized protein n=1 Tax=Psilocybe cyanescens TaxID=93625 RepID=A0A409XN84_PSICY|nr:hypothetical protein CVT25_008982 [Psilocybe cyanescens]
MSEITHSTSISDLLSHINLDEQDIAVDGSPQAPSLRRKARKLEAAARDVESKIEQDSVSDPELVILSDSDPMAPSEEDYLDRVTQYWIGKGLIPPALITRISQHEAPKLNQAELAHPFYKRIMGSVAYSLQRPKTTNIENRCDPHYALGSFIDDHIASRQGRVDKVPFTAFCIVDTEVGHIPDHYGHSTWNAHGKSKRKVEDRHLDTLYRRALLYPALKGDIPEPPPDSYHSLEQCAENIALPYILYFARDFLANGTNGQNITIGSLTMSRIKVLMPFCENCQNRAVNACNGLLGLRIVDRAADPPVIYESDETASFIYAIGCPIKQGGY